MKNFVEILKENASNSTAHGISKISKSKYIVTKCLWALCFLGSLSVCSYCLIDSLNEYISFNVKTLISFKPVPSMEFPTITFCNRNSFKTNDPDFKFREQFSKFFNQTFNGSLNQSRSDLEKQTLALELMSKAFVYSNVKEDDRMNLSYTIDEMLISCNFALSDCDYTDFEYYFSNTYGNCYRFNSGKNYQNMEVSRKVSYNSGKKYGFQLVLYAGIPVTNLAFIKSYGIELFINNGSTIPIMQEEGISIPNGFETNIAISKTIVKRLGPPFSDCEKPLNSDFYIKSIKKLGRYNQKFCLHLCQQSFIIYNCTCYEISSFTLDYSRPCSRPEDLKCVYEQMTTSSPNKSQQCLERCPTECESIYFDYKISQSTFGTPFYSFLAINYTNNQLRNIKNLSHLKETSLVVNIYFDELSYVSIDQEPNKSQLQFVSDIGGTLGLWLGCSLLSILEIFELFIELFAYCCCASKRNSNIAIHD